MTPNDIEILIHFHMSPTRHPRQEFIKATIDWFLRADMIKPLADGDEPDLYQTTVKGAAHVKQLCTLPWPKQAWVGSDGKVIG